MSNDDVNSQAAYEALKGRAQAQARKLERSLIRDTPYGRLGAERLRVIIEDFVERVVTDPMIGFMFRDVDRVRLIELEFQMAARFLGATEVGYDGRNLAAAHRPHNIRAGQFSRRSTILLKTLNEHEVHKSIIEQWMAHTERLRTLITG